MLFDVSFDALMCSCPQTKRQQIDQITLDWRTGRLTLAPIPVEAIESPGRPPKPELVAPRDLTERKLNTPEGQAALIHALAHIEFNAINLALDAIYRFQNLPASYYTDWLKVAQEEAYHFSLLAEHLETLGFKYGDFPAHNGLWEMATKTDYDPLVRMALVPRLMEARGLDITPKIIEKMRSIRDLGAVKILEIIHQDEIGHVAIGNRWYNYLCIERKVCPIETFKVLLLKHGRNNVKPPFAYATRFDAGFTSEEMSLLEDFVIEMKAC